jgi:hypothetical protein
MAGGPIDPFTYYARQQPGSVAQQQYLQQQEQEPAGIDFTKFDLTKPGDQKLLLGHLQTMYGDQKKLNEMAAQPDENQDPLGRMKGAGVNGFIEQYNPYGGSNSS